jgi:hypothetical protein
VQIGEKGHALEPIRIVIAGEAEIRIAYPFKPLAEFAPQSEVKIRMVGVEWNVFHRIEPVASLRRIG